MLEPDSDIVLIKITLVVAL